LRAVKTLSKLLLLGMTATVLRAAVAQTAPTQDRPAPFSVTISTPKETVKSGSEVRLDAVLINTSIHKIVIAGCGCDQDWGYSLEVRDEHGEWVSAADCLACTGQCTDPAKPRSKTVEVCPTVPLCSCTPEIAVHLSLQAHEALKGETLLSSRYDLSRPGKYTIQAKKENDPKTIFTVQGKYGGSQQVEMDDPINDASRATVKSNTITLTVTP
jgi:hypothetical protein